MYSILYFNVLKRISLPQFISLILNVKKKYLKVQKFMNYENKRDKSIFF